MKTIMEFFLVDRTTAFFKSRCELVIVCVFGLLSTLIITTASAGTFSVTPVRVYMASNEQAAAITVTNDGAEELVMQVDIFKWKQTPEGKDLLTLSEDMIMAPPILKMAPSSQQVIRLILLNESARDQQTTYRMIVREIPEARKARADLQLQMAYAFSIPIFITPPGALAKVDCVLSRVSADTAKVVCQNTGSATAHPIGLFITNTEQEKMASQDSGGYILPGSLRSFDLKGRLGNIPKGNMHLVVLMSDGTSQNFDAHLGE
jgi:fimbrial chaperone protein